MPNFLKSRDVEYALQQDLASILTSYDVIAPPLPDDFPDDGLPLVVVERLGGSRTDLVVEEHDVSFDVYADRWASAVDAANTTLAVVTALADMPEQASGVDWHDAQINALPYSNPDPDHEDVPRVTFSAVVTCRPESIQV